MSDSPLVTTDPRNAHSTLFGTPEEVAPDVLMHAAFVNTYAVKTPVGLILIDPGTVQGAASVHEAVRTWTDLALHTVVYTHGHADHAFGLRPFREAGEAPQIVAHANCPKRFERYQLTHGWNANINQRQFGLPKPTFPTHFDWPTLTFDEYLTQRFGDLEVWYTAAKGETDDACYVWIPERRHLFTGDLVIWNAPNCGNPQKVQRYAVEWADALEEMAGLGAEWLFPGHGIAVSGAEAVRTLLTDTARYLRHIIAQVLERMNRGEAPEDIVHAVEPDPDLAALPYLAALYDHPKFIVRNLLRLWGGWWNGNAADLMPATFAAQAQEIAALAGGIAKILRRGRQRLAEGDLTVASHLAEWATRAAPEDRQAQELKRDVYEARKVAERCLMAQGIYRAARNDALAALGENPLPSTHGMSLGGDESA